MNSLIVDGGVWSYGVLGVASLALLMTGLFALLAAFKLRVPSPLWFGLPVLAILVGYVGTLVATNLGKNVLPAIAASQRSAMAGAAWGEALSPAILAWGLVSVLLLVQAWLAAPAHILRAGDQPSWRVGRSALTLILPLLFGVVQSLYLFLTKSPAELQAIPVLLVLGAPALAIACIRVDEEYFTKDAGRLAAGRVVVGASWLGSIVAASVAISLQGERSFYSAYAHAEPSMRGVLSGMAIALQDGVWWPTILAGGLAFILMTSAGLAESKSLESGRTVVGGVLTALLVLTLMVFHLLAMSQGKDLVAVAEALAAAAP